MAINTTNFRLTKDAVTDYYNVNTTNTNLDTIDKALGNTAKFEKAGGTSSAIILTGIEFVDGMSKTFLVTADNNGSATKINGKSLFKPGTVTAPKLITGKAVTVWYDTAGDSGNGCFFIKITTDAETVNGYTVNKDVPIDAVFTDTIYTHPTSDGNTHVPATGTTSNGKVLKSGATAGSASWQALAVSDVSGAAPLANPTFTGTPKAPDGTDYGTARIRNIMAGTADLIAGSSALASGTLYLVYE